MKLRAPATSANIGAGFDTAAVALDLWNDLEVTDGAGVVVEGEGATELAADETNLAVRAYALLADPSGKRFSFLNRIPLERGLGSSAAAIALGLVAAAPDASAEELLAAGLTLEPHADNLAAALLGGLTLSWDGKIARIAERLPLEPIAVIPKDRTSTERSRLTLPTTVPHEEAAASAGRAALLGAGAASGDAELFAAALNDWLHEPYRPSSVLDEVRNSLPAGCAGATLSGSGPTVIAWASDARCGGRAPRPLPGSHHPLARRRAEGCAVSVVLVDVRPRAAYDAGHIPGAVHLDSELELSAIGPDPAAGAAIRCPPTGSWSRSSRGPGSGRGRSCSPSTTDRAGPRAAGGCSVTSATTGPERSTSAATSARSRPRPSCRRRARSRLDPGGRHDHGRGDPRPARRPVARAPRRSQPRALARRGGAARPGCRPDPGARNTPFTEPLPEGAARAPELVATAAPASRPASRRSG